MENKHVFTVNNMTCDGCVSTIQKGLESDVRVQNIDIKLPKKRVTVVGDLTADEAAGIIRNSGYQAEATPEEKGILGSIFSR